MAGVIAGRASVILTGDSSKLQATLAQSQRALADLGAAMQRIGSQVARAMLDMTQQFADAGDRIAKAARRSGIAANDLSALSFVAERSGASLKDVEVGVRNMGRALAESQRGVSIYSDIFKELGLNTQELESMDQSQRFAKIGMAIADLEDPAQQAAYAMRIFGRSGTMLLPIFQSGGRGIEEMTKRFKELGAELTPEMSRNAEALVDAQTDWKFATQGLANAIGNALAPALTEITKLAASFLGWINKILRENKILVTGSFALASAVAALGAAMSAAATYAFVSWAPISSLFSSALVPALSAVGTTLASMATTLISIGAPIAALTYAAAGLVYGFDNVNKRLVGVIDKMLELAGATNKVKDFWAALAGLTVNSSFGDMLLSPEMRQEIKDAQEAEIDRQSIERAQKGQAPLTQAEINEINDRVARDIIDKAATGGEKKPDEPGKGKGPGDGEPTPQVASRAEIIGTFSARGAQGISTKGGSVLEDNSKKQTEYLKKISDNIETVGTLG